MTLLDTLDDRQRGRVYTLLGVMILSFDSLLVRLIDGHEWTLIFWRGLLPAIVLFTVQWHQDRTVIIKHGLRPALSTLLVALLFSASTICFVFSIDSTEVTSTLVIANTAPMITAILAFFWLGERLDKATMLAIVIAVGGIWLVFAGQASPAELKGDTFALVTAVSMSVYLIMLRKTKAQYANVFLIYAGCFTAIISLLAGAQPFSLSSSEALYTVLLCAGVVPFSLLLISLGPKYLPAAEASLILLLEILFGPLLVWWFLGDAPSKEVAMGAAIIVVTLAGHTLWMSRQSPKA
ncbi:DMT family transporter [Photobacterium japonica]|uniref:DMT family transporter n=1 Tax=Photobacterium japonica TaxID=2910235 RepID=UPI003D0D51D3